MNDCFDAVRRCCGPVIVAVKLDDVPPALPIDHVLSAEEHHRSLRFRFPEDRKSYITAHVLKRLLLHRATLLPMSRLVFQTTDSGKPLLTGSDIAFSLSHTRGLAVVALSPGNAIGVDAETTASAFTPGKDLLDLRILSAAELDSISHSQDPARAFLHLWTAKEAVSKAIGCGLSMPFVEIAVDGASAHARGDRWRLQFEYPTPSHIVAVALAAASPHTTFRCIEDKDIWMYLNGR